MDMAIWQAKQKENEPKKGREPETYDETWLLREGSSPCHKVNYQVILLPCGSTTILS
jgi:hypothetical protein